MPFFVLDRRRSLATALCLAAVVAFPAVARAQSDPQPPIVAGPHTCFVAEHAGIDEADARTTTDLVCSELGLVGAPPGTYDVRFGKLGARILLGVSARSGGEDRRMLVQSIDEVPVAVRRLVAALVSQRTVEQTQNVDNVVDSDSRKTKAKSVAAAGYFGLVGMIGAGVTTGGSGGFDLGLLFRVKRLTLGGNLRAGGIGSGDDKLGFVGADMIGRYHFDDGDTSPFVGGGLGLAYLFANGPIDLQASGFDAHLEVGLELFRSSRVGALVSIRADAPFFALTGSSRPSDPYPYYEDSHTPVTTKTAYVVPISLNAGFSFR
jgi:hypothetical protein